MRPLHTLILVVALTGPTNIHAQERVYTPQELMRLPKFRPQPLLGFWKVILPKDASYGVSTVVNYFWFEADGAFGLWAYDWGRCGTADSVNREPYPPQCEVADHQVPGKWYAMRAGRRNYVCWLISDEPTCARYTIVQKPGGGPRLHLDRGDGWRPQLRQMSR